MMMMMMMMMTMNDDDDDDDDDGDVHTNDGLVLLISEKDGQRDQLSSTVAVRSNDRSDHSSG